MSMQTLTMQQIKRYGANALPKNGAAYVMVNSKPRSVVLPIDEYEMLVEALEELEDIRAIEERKDEETISEDEIFA
ncbi:hypothetical protein GF389_03430 [Candidatus Dojkabacteria bacterium]|nr:hypothetical protein [Candidatus Dojkabacteria bacterium]